jgi:ABC-type antimicrobial peptide transport system permease subunit
VLAAFAASALALASIGLYSLLMLLVAERTREMGVRMALGAAPRAIVRHVVAGAGRLVAAGIVAGLMLTLALARVLRALLFGVSPLDAPALGAAVTVLAIVALLAAIVPARRAASIDPIDAMRAE